MGGTRCGIWGYGSKLIGVGFVGLEVPETGGCERAKWRGQYGEGGEDT